MRGDTAGELRARKVPLKDARSSCPWRAFASNFSHSILGVKKVILQESQ